MPQALLQWDGFPQPFDNLSVGSGVTIANVNTGGEFQWDFNIVYKPLGSTASLVGAGSSRTLIPDKFGTYIVQIVVNNDPVLYDKSAGSALYIPSLLREPAPREQVEWDNLNGWAGALNKVYEIANHGAGTKPAAATDVWGRLWHVPGGIGVADTFEVCVKSALDAYSWHDLLAGGGGGTTRFTPVYKTFADTGASLLVAEIDDNFIYVDTTGGNVTLLLPVVGVGEDGIRCTFKMVGANNLILTPAAGTIDGSASLTLTLSNQARNLTYLHTASRWAVY